MTMLDTLATSDLSMNAPLQLVAEAAARLDLAKRPLGCPARAGLSAGTSAFTETRPTNGRESAYSNW